MISLGSTGHSIGPDETMTSHTDDAAVACTFISPLKDAITDHFITPSVETFDDGTSHLYQIKEVFKEPYWNELQLDRFEFSYVNGIFYRPDIVNEIVSKIEANLGCSQSRGLLIKGPLGIGKLHSIVNVVRKLQSTGEYLVTFIPDCENWHFSFDLVNAICLSVGITAETVGIRKFDDTPATLLNLISEVTEVLEALDKQWVFVFDQIYQYLYDIQMQKI